MIDSLLAAPRRVLALISAGCLALLSFGLYLQLVVGLEPCPMCIVQRYAMILLGISCAIGAAMGGRGARTAASGVGLLFAGFGAFVAARQSWLQWFPPEVSSCGRDFYGMIESFPLQRVIPMIFRGSGDCTKVDWSFLGGSIANWSFLSFIGFGTLLVVVGWRALRNPTVPASR